MRGKMIKKQSSELEILENWDSSKAETRKPEKPQRVVFSVAFKRDDFDLISRYAELCGKKTSEFIRDAAIERTMMENNLVSFAFGSGSLGTIWTIDQLPSITGVSAFRIERPEDVSVFTS